MNKYLFIAAFVAFLVGLAHSVLGEKFIFNRLRWGHVVPSNGTGLLQGRHVRILWASWHALTVFGWCIAAVLFWLSLPLTGQNQATLIESAIVVASLVSSALVCFATRGRHLGWLGLMAIAICVWISRMN